MKFPPYVPSAVREQVTWYLEGSDKFGWEGWLTSLKNGTLSAELQRDVECMTRLVEDRRMRLVYESMPEFSNESWDLFFKAAWCANAHFSKVRQICLTTNNMMEEIGKKALELAQLLENIPSPMGNLPDELFDMYSLLQMSENCHHWMGGVVLGSNDALKDKKDVIEYVWSKAPPPSALLRIMSSVAFNYEMDLDGSYMRKAISSRKKNPKTEYLRSFKALLIQYGIELSPAVINAIANTAMVVLNDPNIDVSYDDVRHA